MPDSVVPVPTQVHYPIKAVLRTVVAAILGAVATFAIRHIPGFDETWAQYGTAIVDMITNVIFVAITGFFTWLFALPKVNAVLTTIGLGAQPKVAVTVIPETPGE